MEASVNYRFGFERGYVEVLEFPFMFATYFNPARSQGTSEGFGEFSDELQRQYARYVRSGNNPFDFDPSEIYNDMVTEIKGQITEIKNRKIAV